MEQKEVLDLYSDYLRTPRHSIEETNEIWTQKSKEFREFWINKIMNKDVKSITEAEIDQIVRILDRNGKGNTSKDTAVARVMVPQGVWRRMFNEIKSTEKLRDALDAVLSKENDDELISAIDKLYEINKGRKNGLTGKSGNAINAMMFAYNPNKYVSVVSLNDRRNIINHFGFENKIDFDSDSQGKKIMISNKEIIEGFKNIGITSPPRVVSNFLYTNLKPYWKSDEAEADAVSDKEGEARSETSSKEIRDPELFYMESHLEEFLIANWDKTEFGKRYDLIMDNDGNLVSEQFKTDVGKIDILVREKQNGEYVVIELKKDQTSDDTVGQLTRYMGWVKEHLANGKEVKGIIIAANPDKRLYYALKIVNRVKFYTYQVNFALNEENEKFN